MNPDKDDIKMQVWGFLIYSNRSSSVAMENLQFGILCRCPIGKEL